jgi:Mg2+ and Co2+ transporter CorA
MTLLSVKSTADQEDRSGDVPRAESMNGQPPCPPNVSSSQREEGADSFFHSARRPEEPVWVDLRSPDQAQLEEVRQALGFSPEVITHCLRPAHTPKVIPIDSALFMVTFLGAPAPQGLFALRALKICVAPGFLLTVRSRSSTTLGVRRLRLPEVPHANNGRTGHLLRLILEGAVQSYKTIGADLRKRLAREAQRDAEQWQRERIWRQQMSRKGEQFVRFLRQQRMFLQEVERAGGMLFDANDRVRLRWLAERVGVLARRVEEIIRTPREEKNLMEQELTAILTETEKQTVLIGGRFALAHFTKVDLSRAVFREADLEGTKFVQTDLRGADFRRANLQGAVFSLCDLHGADFTGARLEGANFLTSFGLSPALWGYIRVHGGMV